MLELTWLNCFIVLKQPNNLLGLTCFRGYVNSDFVAFMSSECCSSFSVFPQLCSLGFCSRCLFKFPKLSIEPLIHSFLNFKGFGNLLITFWPAEE